ncbi:MAG: hypothetical protein U0Q16_02900 [Bryobacteraceae bacterium]
MAVRFHYLVAFAMLASPLFAVPRLRLSQTVIGPISVAQGGSPEAQEIEVLSVDDAGVNAETASLRPTFSSTAPWVSAAASPVRNCTKREGQCIPVRFSFASQQLQAGTYSATVTITDANALDAPQPVLVMLTVGSNVPGSAAFFVAPNGSSDEVKFSTNGPLTATWNTQSGGDWLSLVQLGAGSYDFVVPSSIRVKHLDGMAEATYNGTVRVQNAKFAGDNKNVSVSMRVTSQPIAAWGRDTLRIRLAKDSTKLSQTLRIGNRGLGTLTVSGVTSTMATGTGWLAAEQFQNLPFATLTFDTASVAPGIYKGNVAVASNAVNSPVNLPVELEVVPQGAPFVRYRGIIENAAFQEGDAVANGGIVAAFGEQLSYEQAQSNKALPLPVEMGGAKVFVNDKQAPLFFTSYNQINFQIPYDTPPGEARVRVDRGSQRGNTVTVKVVSSAPKFLRLQLRAAGINISEDRDFFGIAVNASDGTFSLPKEFGIPNSRPSKKGEVIVLYGLGMGPTIPPVREGEAAPNTPARVASDLLRVFFGAQALSTGAQTDALFAGLTPGLVGLYQVNVQIPEDSPTGDVAVRIQLDQAASEYAFIAVE